MEDKILSIYFITEYILKATDDCRYGRRTMDDNEVINTTIIPTISFSMSDKKVREPANYTPSEAERHHL